MAIEAKPARRRTQAERSAGTRARILTAALTCLYKHGYGATTTVSVAATAKVSRGAMLHHFPSKADLMLATLAHVLELNAVNFRKAAAKITDPRERHVALADLRLAAASQPGGVAFMEIMVGARSDETVRRRFAEFQALLFRANERHAEAGDDQGIRLTPKDVAVSRTVTLATFGLAIQKQIDPDTDVEDVMQVLRELKRSAMEPA